MTFPSWWSDGVRVISRNGTSGTIMRAGIAGDWLVHLDGDEGSASYMPDPEPAEWAPEVRTRLTQPQFDRVVHDAERALLRAFGCHYVPEYEALPERMRVGVTPRPNAVGRPELDGIRAVIRGALMQALRPYVGG